MAEVKFTALDISAAAYDKEMFGTPTAGKTVELSEEQASKFIIGAFKAGAQWQKQQDKEMFDVIKELYDWAIRNNTRGPIFPKLEAAYLKATT
jgi:hypothetical protein